MLRRLVTRAGRCAPRGASAGPERSPSPSLPALLTLAHERHLLPRAASAAPARRHRHRRAPNRRGSAHARGESKIWQRFGVLDQARSVHARGAWASRRAPPARYSEEMGMRRAERRLPGSWTALLVALVARVGSCECHRAGAESEPSSRCDLVGWLGSTAGVQGSSPAVLRGGEEAERDTAGRAGTLTPSSADLLASPSHRTLCPSN